MRKYLSLAAVALFASFGAGSAFAQSATQNITLSATVPGYCTVGGGASATTASATDIPVTNGTPDTSLINVSGLGAVNCNENIKLTLTSLNGGVLGGAGVAGYSNRIDYTASATYSGLTQTLTTSGTPGQSSGITAGLSTGGASSSATLGVTITPITPANVLLPGAYSDTLAVLLTPSP